MFDLIKCYWCIINWFSVYFSLGFLMLGGFVVGVVFWGVFNIVMEVINIEVFCMGCYEMYDNVYQELQSIIYYINCSGVCVICFNCYVLYVWMNKIVWKMQVFKEVWGKIFGIIDMCEKFEVYWFELVQYEWDWFKVNDLLECCNCYNYELMDFM